MPVYFLPGYPYQSLPCRADHLAIHGRRRIVNILREYYENRWTPETAGTAKYPAITDNKNENNFQTSTQYMRDGTYLKLKKCRDRIYP